MLRYLIFLWHVMLRCMILSYVWCSATWSFCNTSCYAAWSCLVSDTPLLDLSVTCMLRCKILSYVWCSATWSFCDMNATLHDLVLCLMLRYLIFLWHVMLRCMILSYVWCSATWSFCDTSCYAAWSCLLSDAPLLDLSVTCHATLHDLVLCLMLRYLIFLWRKTYLPSWPLVLRTKKNWMNWFGHMWELGSGAGRQHLLDLLCWKKQAVTCPRWTSNRLRVLKLGFRREKARCPANFPVRNLIKIQ